MIKRILSLFVCLVIVVSAFAGCSAKLDENDKGAHINMYLTDMVYDLDPANAFINESALRIVSLLYDNLFFINEDGKLEESLATGYEIIEDETVGLYKMVISINKDAMWSDGSAVTADNVVYAWKRVLDNEKSYDAASLLFEIKNARAAKAGDVSIDDVAIYSLNEKELTIEFEEKIDYEQFLFDVTSYALVPLREDIVSRAGDDWAKKPSTMVTSGPFKLRSASYEEKPAKSENDKEVIKEIMLERNPYYYRDYTKDAYDISVKPYRLIINYSMTDEEIMQAYEDGEIFYVGDIPLSVRNDYKDKAVDALSTHTYVLNQNAVIRKYDSAAFKELSSNKNVFNKELVEGTDGEKIFANANVRKALSLAIDREAIAEAVVFAKVASGLVPYGIKETNTKKASSFRSIGGDLIDSDNIDEAKTLLANAGIKPSDYMFAISVAEYDDVHMEIAKMVQAAWEKLGFHVAINAIKVITNDEISKLTQEVDKSIKDDVFAEAYRAGEFEVAAIDFCATSANAYSMLSVFAKAFSGAGMDMTNLDYALTPHISGYDSEAYNELMEKVYAEKDIAKRATLLHEAEEMLLEDMPVIPVIFNQNASLVSDELSKVENTYFGVHNFTKTKLKNYEDYISEEE